MLSLTPAPELKRSLAQELETITLPFIHKFSEPHTALAVRLISVSSLPKPFPAHQPISMLGQRFFGKKCEPIKPVKSWGWQLQDGLVSLADSEVPDTVSHAAPVARQIVTVIEKQLGAIRRAAWVADIEDG